VRRRLELHPLTHCTLSSCYTPCIPYNATLLRHPTRAMLHALITLLQLELSPAPRTMHHATRHPLTGDAAVGGAGASLRNRAARPRRGAQAGALLPSSQPARQPASKAARQQGSKALLYSLLTSRCARATCSTSASSLRCRTPCRRSSARLSCSCAGRCSSILTSSSTAQMWAPHRVASCGGCPLVYSPRLARLPHRPPWRYRRGARCMSIWRLHR
jgi:hypothetical protein